MSGFKLPDRAPLVQFSPKDRWTVEDSFTGCQIFGMTGSGKTSGSGQALARAMLRAGYGFLVLTAKPDEADYWRRLAADTGRADELLVFGDNEHRFNFLNYELAASGGEASVNNAVAVFQKIMEAGQVAQSKGGSDNVFWSDAVAELLTYTIMVLYAATGSVRLDDVLKMASTAPTPQDMQPDHVARWQKSSFCHQTLKRCFENPSFPLAPEDMRAAHHYFHGTFGRLDLKTRSNITISLTSAARPFITGRLRKLFCTATTIVPEMTHQGMILVLDMPQKTWFHDGAIAQQLFKYCWQRATERRTGRALKRPVCLWADESQFFINSYDAEFLATARSSRVCTVYLTQSYQAYIDRMKFLSRPDAATDAILNNLNLKVFHLLNDEPTKEYASKAVGTASQYRKNMSRGTNQGLSASSGTSFTGSTNEGWSWGRSKSRNRGHSSSYSSESWTNGHSWGDQEGYNEGGTSGSSTSYGSNRSDSYSRGENMSEGYSEVVESELAPDTFSRDMRTGGSENDFMVDGIVYRPGKPWRHSRKNWMPVRFTQK